MIRVLHIVGSMNRGGIQAFIMNVYRNIDRNKIQFDFLLSTDKECDYNAEIQRLGGKIFSILPRKQGFLKNRKSLDYFFSQHPEYRIIHQHVSSLSYVEPLKIAEKYGVHIRIVHGHSTKEGGSLIHKYIHRWNQLKINSYATDYFACSELVAKWLYGKVGYNSRRFTVINNGIEVERFAYSPEIRKNIRNELGIQNNFVIGHVGRFAYPKNHEFLIDVFKEVIGLNPSFLLLLVGDGEKKPFIEQKVADLKLSDNVIFLGDRNDISHLLQAMDVFVFPSHYEGLPVALVEAQTAGLPCLISDNITDEIVITDLINKLSLNTENRIWAEKILEFVESYERKDTQQDIRQSGYDISETIKSLEIIYTQSLQV